MALVRNISYLLSYWEASMQHLIVFVMVCSLVASAFLVQQGGPDCPDTFNRKLCETPKRPFYNLSDENDESRILFIFNNETGLCESTLIDPRYHNHTFSSRFECVSVCNPDQGAPFCAADPTDPCDEYDDYRQSYFYNVTSKQCENYTVCNDTVDRSTDVNFYVTDHYCLFDCGGFDVSNVYGSNSTKQDV